MSDYNSWCHDECPTCSNVVPSGATYCSAACQPDPEPVELLPPYQDPFHYAPPSRSYSQSNNARITTWAWDCDRATHSRTSLNRTPSPSRMSPSIYTSGRKLHLRDSRLFRPTARVTTREELEVDCLSPLSPSSAICAGTKHTALEALSACSAPSTSPPTAASLARYLTLGRRGSCPPVTSSRVSTKPAAPRLLRVPLAKKISYESAISTLSSTVAVDYDEGKAKW
uniref:Uncharacterized protein n=1 Tax=Mycena chlorophos TaxID=658473 RepID=A0ABQ0KX89_MYCCL|nr:predicted protein [Mycena chlorophos]